MKIYNQSIHQTKQKQPPLKMTENETTPIKIKKPIKKRKVVTVIYLNNLPTDNPVKSFKQKIDEKYCSIRLHRTMVLSEIPNTGAGL